MLLPRRAVRRRASPLDSPFGGRCATFAARRVRARSWWRTTATLYDFAQRMGKKGPPLAYHRLIGEGRLRHVVAMNFTTPPPDYAVLRMQCVGAYQ